VLSIVFVQELEAIKARVREMEEEAEKIRQMQNEVEKQMNRSTSSTLSECSGGIPSTNVYAVLTYMWHKCCLFETAVICSVYADDFTLQYECVFFSGTSSVEDKLDADGRSIWIGNVCFFLLADRTNGRAYATVLRPCVVCCL